MASALLIGNFVRGFNAVTGFESDEEALNWQAEHRHFCGSECRLITSTSFSDIVSIKEVLQDALEYGRPQPGEELIAGGLSVDTIDHNPAEDKEPQPNAEHSPVAAEDRAGTDEDRARLSGDNASLSDVSGAGGTVPGSGEDETTPR